ncbi:hypothetical protein G9A89_019753 [Geosiphon pyriformis]|nr:hypothetical protein G9A89_019753 [Geosiphon pyriformis]
MTYWDIAKLEKFSGKEDNTYSWIADAEKAITTNGWNDNCTYQSLAEKPIFFTEFKLAFLQYFCDPNTIIKQKDHKAVTTYLKQFNQILRQILAIEKDYYTTVQVVNQFIKGLQSSILRSIRPHHLTSLQDAITFARDFESAEQKANHTQAINLAINRTSDIDPELQELTNHSNREKITTTADTHSNKTISNSNNLRNLIPTTEDHRPKSRKPIPAIQISAKHGTPIFYTSELTAPICTTNPVHLTTAPELLSTTTNDTSNLSLLNFPLQNLNNNQVQTNSGLSQSIPRGPAQSQLTPTGYSNQASYLGLMEDQGFDKSTPIITVDGNTKTLIGEIDNFSFEINGIQIPTKVLVMEATQYQALVRNNWLSKANATLNWNTQELQLTFNGQHARVPAMCRHFKNQRTEEPLIEFEDISMPPTIEIY